MPGSFGCLQYSSSNLSDSRPRSEPALELHSRAASSVGIMYHSSGPNTGSNTGGGWIQKNNNNCYSNISEHLKIDWYYAGVLGLAWKSNPSQTQNIFMSQNFRKKFDLGQKLSGSSTGGVRRSKTQLQTHNSLIERLFMGF